VAAALTDYAAVYALAQETYAESAAGAGARVRAVIDAVTALRDDADEQDGRPVTIHAVGKALDVSYSTARYRCHAALHAGWLVNLARVEGRYDLAPADETGPRPSGMPTVEALAHAIATSHAHGPTAEQLLEGVRPLILPVSIGDVVTPRGKPWEVWPSAVASPVTNGFGDEQPSPHHQNGHDALVTEEILAEQGPAVDVTNSPTETEGKRGGVSDPSTPRPRYVLNTTPPSDASSASQDDSLAGADFAPPPRQSVNINTPSDASSANQHDSLTGAKAGEERHPADVRIVVQAYRDVLPEGAADLSHRSLYARLLQLTDLAGQAVGALITSAVHAGVLVRVRPLVYRLGDLA
jgi:hypothetical protein